MDLDSLVEGEACIVLQKRHLPDKPLEYLLKLRWMLKSGIKYREKWFTADQLRAEFAVGDALIKQFEASKVGQLAVDTYLSKRRSLPSPKSLAASSDTKNSHFTSTADGGPRHKNFKSDGKATKRKLCDVDQRHSASNCIASISLESLKGTGVAMNNNSTPLSSSKSSTHVAPSSFYSNTTQPGSHHKNFTKRLLLFDKVPHRNLVSRNSSKDLKLPNLLKCKPASQKPIIVSCKQEDTDSDADIKYSLAMDHSGTPSECCNPQSSSCSEKKRRKLTLIGEMKKSKRSTGTIDSKQPKVVAADADVKFKASSLLAGGSSYKAVVRLKDCSHITSTAASLSSAVEHLPNGSSGSTILENGNGGQHLKLSPIVLSPAVDGKKTNHVHDEVKKSKKFLHVAGSKMKHFQFGGGMITENCSNGQQSKSSPALPSPAVDGKKTNHDKVKKLENFPIDGGKFKHLPIPFVDLKKHDDSGSECLTPYSEGRRISVRQTELAYRFKEIVVRKMNGYMHVSLVSQTRGKNAINPKVFNELQDALHNACSDDSRVLLLTGSGNVFCSGIDLHYLLNECSDRREAARTMSDSLRDFVSALISFPKPVVVAVNGPAMGFGMALLALCDVVYASDKASFSCPYTTLCQTPEACASYTLPKILGSAMANELLLCGRKITALQACQAGLLSQVFWPTNMMQEVIPRVQNLASQSAKVLEATKALIQSHQRRCLEQVNITECQLLSERWASADCQSAMRQYLESASDSL